MPGTTYPPNPYPGQLQRTDFMNERVSDTGAGPNMSPQTRSNQNLYPDIPQRRLTPYEIVSNANSNFLYNPPPFDANSGYPNPPSNEPNSFPIQIPSRPHTRPHPPIYYHSQHFIGGGGGERMFSYFALPPQNHSNVPAINTNMNFPPPPPPSVPPPPPPPHMVWILDCRNCGTFLSNRGMKVCRSARTFTFCRSSCHRL